MRLVMVFLLLASKAALAIDLGNVKGGPLIEVSRLVLDSGGQIPYKENSFCAENIKKDRCMAIGFSFDYARESETDLLYCRLDIDDKGKLFKLYEGEIKLPEKKGNFLIPTSLKKDPGDTGTIKISLGCHGIAGGKISKDVLVNFDH